MIMTRFATASCLTLLLAFSAKAVQADPDLDRLQTLAQKATNRIGSAIATTLPRGKRVPPKLAWTPALQDAAACTLAKYRERIGKQKVTDLLNQAERELSRQIFRMEDAKAAGERLRPLPRKEMTEIDLACGFTLAGLQSLLTDANFSAFMSHETIRFFRPSKK